MKEIYDGILVTDIKVNNENSRIFITREKVKFDKNKKQDYINKFEKYKREGIILSENFNENIWVISQQEDGYKEKASIKFNFEIRKNINQVLKFFCLDLITNMIGIKRIALNINTISDCLFISNFFNEDYFEDFEDYIFNCSEDMQTKVKDILWSYISYFANNIPNEYLVLLRNIANAPKKARILPDYRSILYFDYFIKDFLDTASYELKIKYYPILLWWEISSYIPMRVIEFSRIKKKDCCKVDKDYFISVTRAKPHSYIDRALKLRKKQKFKINKKLYDMICEYVSAEEHNSKYLLSYNLYKKYFAKNSVRADYELIPKFNLYNMLESFYNEIIVCRYGYMPISKNDVLDLETRSIKKISGNNIVKLQLGDTRHLAIMNLILLGRNPYTIKELAGHNDINSFQHYGNHIEKFVEAKTIVLTDAIRMQRRELEKNILSSTLENRRLLNVRNLLIKKGVDTGDLIKVNNGYCLRYKERLNLYPYLCQGSCKNCNDLVRDTNVLNELEVEKEISDINSNINLYIEIIKSYLLKASQKRLINKPNNKLNVKSKSILNTTLNKLKVLINQKASAEAYKLKIGEIDKA